VRNFLQGHGLVFNTGECIEGYTNLGHVLAVIVLGAAGLDLVTAARILGVAGGIAAVVFGPAVILPDSRGQALQRSIARLLLLSNFFFVYLSYTGMETGLYIGLICIMCFVFKNSGDHAGYRVGALAGSLFVVRPDGALFGLALFGLAAVSHGARRVVSMPGPWVWIIIVLAVEAFRFFYYGELVPNTALIKGLGSTEASSTLPWYGLVGDDVVEMLAQSGGVAAVFFAFVALLCRPKDDRVWLAVVMCAATVTFAIYAGGDWMLGYRFLLPLLPFYFSLVAIGIVEVLAALRGRTPVVLTRYAFLGTILIVAISSWSIGLEFHQHGDQYPNTHMTSRYMVPAAKWIAAHYPADYQVTAAAIGSLGYHSNLTIIDTIGLTDSHIARLRADRTEVEAYIHERNPELALVNAAYNEPFERNLYGRMYRIERYFRRGIERPWLLYVREDIPLAAAADPEPPVGSNAPMRRMLQKEIPPDLLRSPATVDR
jgi:hypothetical protein